mgnify:CR=1 FL=1
MHKLATSALLATLSSLLAAQPDAIIPPVAIRQPDVQQDQVEPRAIGGEACRGLGQARGLDRCEFTIEGQLFCECR